MPDKCKTELWIELMFKWLFSLGEEYDSEVYHHKQEEALKNQLLALITSVNVEANDAIFFINDFFRKLENIHLRLEEDLDTIYANDPAAASVEEVVITYPGFFAITCYRIAHLFWEAHIPILPRFISEYVHGKTGIDIHPGAEIGSHFFIDHGTGIVVGETTIIGNNVKLYQGVTLGALSVNKDLAEKKRHPTIGNNVTIYANATILGGDTYIGDNSVIGGNVWLTTSIPEDSLVFQKSEFTLKSKIKYPEPINFVI